MNDPIAHARVHDELFVPAEFRAWAPRVLDAAQVTRGDRLLDVACGTGVVARAAAERVGPTGFVAGIDADRGMLAVAAERLPGIEWRLASAERLPFPEARFDVVVCQFGLMFFRDRVGALREMRRVLSPDGRLAVSVWDRVEHTPAYDVLIAVTERVAGGRAADALREPFALGDASALAEPFAAAAARDVEIVTVEEMSDFPSVRSLVDAELLGWLPAAGITLEPDMVHQIRTETEVRLAPYVAADGRLRFPSPAHIVTARR